MSMMPMAARPRWTGSLAVATLIACGAPAVFAMGIRESKQQLARSANGAAALYEIRGHGPEGGGALTYRVQGKTARGAVDFVVSSDYGPGDGSRPETVSPEVCRQRVESLAAEIAMRKILGVTVHPEACASKSRDGVVVPLSGR